jgi:hypothetical protein
MITKIIVPLSIVLGSIFAQAEINFSYEMKYGDGKQVTSTLSGNPDTSAYNYFENLLDINTNFGDNLYIYSQFEYSNPPVFGFKRTTIDSVMSTFYLEYSNDRYNVKLGDIFELYGRGMSFYTLHDQSIDYNNSIKGFTLNYSIRDNLEFSTLLGKGDYFYRSNPSNRLTDYSFETNVFLGSINYVNNLIGDIQYSYIKQKSTLSPELIKKIYNNTFEISVELKESKRADSYKNYFLFNQGIGMADTIIANCYNLNWNNFLGPFDIYIDKAWVNYDKIYGDEVFGSRFYTAVYTDFMGTGITYEYKNYNTPYLIKTLSNPPIVYRVGSSVLASRNAHSINFGNEIGHQVDFNRQLFDNINVLGNLSLSYRHQKEGMADLSILDFLTMNEDSEIYDYYPFRQMYLEMNGWAFSEQIYYKIGMDHYTEFIGGKNTFALTFPTHWVYKLSNGNSLTIYLENQEKTVKRFAPGSYTSNYTSISYSQRGRWIITGFYDQEISKSKTTQWPGIDFTFYLNSESQISLFYGSQKGGLVCANGICAEQPGFEDGVKITFRSLF